MDLRTSFPYWLIKDGSIHDYNSLTGNIATEVVVMGAGITGALISYQLVKAGIPVVVIDKRHVGTGSTAATTGLLQYEIDEPLHRLITMVGKERAGAAYLACYEAIDSFEKIINTEKIDAGFRKKPSLQFATYKKDAKALEIEYGQRKKIGIELELLDRSFIKENYGFDSDAGLFSQKAAEVDAYALTQQLFDRFQHQGLQVFHNTRITNIDYTSTGVLLKTDRGNKIRARRLVIACGYESQKFIDKKVEQLLSTYVTISEPVTDAANCWYRDSLIWETARPYLYIRTTTDNRILVGGKDDDFYDPRKRSRNIDGKSILLQKSFSKLFPSVPFRSDYEWAGVFGVTKDSLPYIGTIPSRPHEFFALGFGGNGIIYSVIAAEIIRDAITGRKNELAGLFSFNR